MTSIRAFALLAVVVAAPLPAAAQNRAEIQMMAELRILHEQQVQLSLAIQQLSQALTESVNALNARLDQTNQSFTRSAADQAVGLKQMGDELRVIREGTQATSTQLGRLREEVEALRASLPSLLTRLQPVVPPTGDPLDPNAVSQTPPPLAPADPGVVLPPPPPPSTAGISPERLFNTARADYGAGQFSLAISGFERFIATFPDSQLADDAQLSIGDAELALMRYDEAIAAYNRVIQNYPNGDQVAWAYYKRALVERRQQRPEMARASLEAAIKAAGSDAHPVWSLANQVLDGLTRAPEAPSRP